MKHAGEKTLDALEILLQEIRQLTGLTEQKRGAFYRKGVAMLHFHEDPAGFFADVKLKGEWRRFPANTAAEQTFVLEQLRTATVALSNTSQPCML